jgi:hypothetical protein
MLRVERAPRGRVVEREELRRQSGAAKVRGAPTGVYIILLQQPHGELRQPCGSATSLACLLAWPRDCGRDSCCALHGALARGDDSSRMRRRTAGPKLCRGTTSDWERPILLAEMQGKRKCCPSGPCGWSVAQAGLPRARSKVAQWVGSSYHIPAFSPHSRDWALGRMRDLVGESIETTQFFGLESSSSQRRHHFSWLL